MPDERAVRIASNETRFRDINERLKQDIIPLVDEEDELLPFVCECGRRGCKDAIELSLTEYEAVRADSAQFAIAVGHQIEDVEDVVLRTERYFVVRKHPPTVAIAVAADPRR